MTLIITLYEPLHIVGHLDWATPAAHYDSLIGGLHTTSALVAHGGAQSGIQIRLSPLGARALLGMPAGVLAGQDVAAADVLGTQAGELQERLAETDSWPVRFAILDRTFARRLAGVHPPPRPVSEAWRLLLGSGGQLPVAAIAGQVGWSERQLTKRFRQEIGLTPKAAARVVRFHRARHELQSQLADDGDTDIAAVAASCGYFDQPHLVRDFRQFAGLPPSHWVREEFPKRTSVCRPHGSNVWPMNDTAPHPRSGPHYVPTTPER
jgi:AraC-like DNA-binding protein